MLLENHRINPAWNYVNQLIVYFSDIYLGHFVGWTLGVQVYLYIVLYHDRSRWLRFSANRRYFPIGVVFLLCAAIGRGDELGEHTFNIGVYIATVMTGLAIHALVVLPLIYFLYVRKNPFIFAKNLFHAFVTAFGTSDRWGEIDDQVFYATATLNKRKGCSSEVTNEFARELWVWESVCIAAHWLSSPDIPNKLRVDCVNKAKFT